LKRRETCQTCCPSTLLHFDFIIIVNYKFGHATLFPTLYVRTFHLAIATHLVTQTLLSSFGFVPKLRWQLRLRHCWFYWLQLACNILRMENSKCLAFSSLGTLYLTMEITTTFKHKQKAITIHMASTSQMALLEDFPMDESQLTSLVTFSMLLLP